MRTALFLLLSLVHAAKAFTQPDPWADIHVSQATVLPAEPTTTDTLTVTYHFVGPSACNYIRDWTLDELPGLRRHLLVRVTKPPEAICTTDKDHPRTATMRIPPLPAGDYQLLMEGNWRVEGHQFRLGGMPVRFSVREP